MDADMDTSDAAASPSKRLGIKNTIQTSFGDDYIFQIASSPEIPALAVSLSSNIIKLYSPATGQYIGDCKGHRGTIHEISFSSPASPNVLSSCSSDGSIRAWDIRTFNQVSLLKTPSSQQIYSFSFGGSTNNLLAAGCDAQILFWDWRNLKQVACLEESHMDDVTQVRFVPNQPNKLISASVDGLMCLFDTNVNIDDDNHWEAVMNAETSIAKIGFCGQMNESLWCLTHIETLSIWDWKDGKRLVSFEDTRALASDKWNLDQVDYFVDCYYTGIDDRLWLIGGTGSGTLGYFPVSYGGTPAAIGFPEAILEGGHTGVVRSILPVPRSPAGPANSRNIFGWTGGEDGRLCCWSPDESVEVKNSWISNSLVMRSRTGRSKIRHTPY